MPIQDFTQKTEGPCARPWSTFPAHTQPWTGQEGASPGSLNPQATHPQPARRAPPRACWGRAPAHLQSRGPEYGQPAPSSQPPAPRLSSYSCTMGRGAAERRVRDRRVLGSGARDEPGPSPSLSAARGSLVLLGAHQARDGQGLDHHAQAGTGLCLQVSEARMAAGEAGAKRPGWGKGLCSTRLRRLPL